MLSPLFKGVNWNHITSVGFDMDGTLYDEFDFIKQVYSEINKQLILNDSILSFMTKRWLEKGSSYPLIFSEAYDKCKSTFDEKEDFVKKALDIYRNFSPKISLNNRNKKLMSYFQENFKLYLITDGNHELQKKKFASLGLSKYFDNENIVFTGAYKSDYHKPKNKSLELIDINMDNSVFFGDRDVDKEFALSSNIQFIRVHNMLEVS